MVDREPSARSPVRPPAWRVEAGRLAALMGATGVAVAQPVLDAFGRSPESLVFRRAEGFDLVLFAAGVALGPPVTLWVVGLLIGALARRRRMALHGATIGGVLALAVVPVLSDAAVAAQVAVVAVVAIGAWMLTVRSPAFRMWSRYLAAVALLAPALFLVASPASDLVSGRGFEAVAGEGDRPVVVIVLDELATASIIDADGAIDPVRFPNLARLAADGTWYRNHTTVAGYTREAVPAILTGRLPSGEAPIFANYPDNLFRLLAESHELVVAESLTRLCPTSVCGEGPGGDGASGGSGPELAALFGDAADLWRTRLGGGSGDVDFGGFEESVVTSAPPRDDGADIDDVGRAQPERLRAFLDALQPGGRPLAAVLHLVAPHQPWRRLPDGQTYAESPALGELAHTGGRWVSDVERQRHLFQASDTDRLVGLVLDRLEEIGVYDDATIALTADHGVTFHAGPNRRLPWSGALPEVMWTPLIVKGPGQHEPVVDDSNAMTIDVVPTLAERVGTALPWSVDGLVLGSAEQRARGPAKTLMRFESAADPSPDSVQQIDGTGPFATMLGLSFPPITPDDDPGRGLYQLSDRADLLGQRFEPAGTARSGAVTVADAGSFRAGDPRPLAVTGSVGQGRSDDRVVVAVDGRIVGVSPVFDAKGTPSFALLLPAAGDLDVGAVRIGLLRDGELLDAGPLA